MSCGEPPDPREVYKQGFTEGATTVASKGVALPTHIAHERLIQLGALYRHDAKLSHKEALLIQSFLTYIELSIVNGGI